MIVVEVGVKLNVKLMVAAPHKKNHQNDVLNWVQNNSSIFLKLIVEQLKISGFNR
jgi:hypothetical protein